MESTPGTRPYIDDDPDATPSIRMPAQAFPAANTARQRKKSVQKRRVGPKKTHFLGSAAPGPPKIQASGAGPTDSPLSIAQP